MVGYPCPWAYLAFINLTQMSQRTIDKRLGYLCIASFIQPEDEISVMNVQSFLKDLSSIDKTEVCMALQTMAAAVNNETVPAVWDHVMKHLENSDALVRKKAVMVLKRMIELDPERAVGLELTLKKLLCDRHPSVMGTFFPSFSRVFFLQ